MLVNEPQLPEDIGRWSLVLLWSPALQPAENQKNLRKRKNIARSRPLPPLPPQFGPTMEVEEVVQLLVARALIWRLEVEVVVRRRPKNLIQNQTIEIDY